MEVDIGYERASPTHFRACNGSFLSANTDSARASFKSRPETEAHGLVAGKARRATGATMRSIGGPVDVQIQKLVSE